MIGRFNAYFEPKRNAVHERAKFHKRNQKEGESVEEYIRHLYEPSEHADFADRESTIRDRLIDVHAALLVLSPRHYGLVFVVPLAVCT